jgi:hypothetical protein
MALRSPREDFASASARPAIGQTSIALLGIITSQPAANLTHEHHGIPHRLAL